MQQDPTRSHLFPVEFHGKAPESISVREFYESNRAILELDLVAGEKGLDRVIGEKSINRPALALTGYNRYLATKRIQLLGAGEMAYLRDHDGSPELDDALDKFIRRPIPCLIISRSLAPTRALTRLVRKYDVPLFRSSLKSKSLSTEATLVLEEHFAPRVHLHGTLLDIKGIGTLIKGESGIGKSECALALIERGHSLVSDDITHVRLLRDHELVGTGPDLNRGYMECRGLGIIDVAKLFGVRSVRIEKRIDLVIHFQAWTPDMREDRTGLDHEEIVILGQRVRHIRIPVRPGRDLARLVEVAALIQAFHFMGHDAAAEFNDRLIRKMTGDPPG